MRSPSTCRILFRFAFFVTTYPTPRAAAPPTKVPVARATPVHLREMWWVSNIRVGKKLTNADIANVAPINPRPPTQRSRYSKAPLSRPASRGTSHLRYSGVTRSFPRTAQSAVTPI